MFTRPARQFIKEAESVALLHNTLPQAVKSDRALLNNNKTTKTHCTMSPSKNRGNNGMHLKGGESNEKFFVLSKNITITRSRY